VDQKDRMTEQLKQDSLTYLISKGLVIPDGMYVDDVQLLPNSGDHGIWVYVIAGIMTFSEYTLLIDTKIHGFTVEGEWVSKWARLEIHEV
jgi:hypothetical protein